MFIAGDLFHRQPLLRELKEVRYLFEQIPNTHVFLVAGNHDYLKKDSYYWMFLWPSNVHMLMTEEISSVEVPDLSLGVYGCSYHKREYTDAIYDLSPAPRRYSFEVLLAHGGDEKHIPIQRNKLKSLGYDYIALGHLHKPQKLIFGIAYYSGALEPVDRNDTGRHGYMQGTITHNGVEVNFVSCSKRIYIHQEILVVEGMTGYALKRQIMDIIEESGVHNIYKLILTGLRDPGALFYLNDMDVYGNIIDIVDNTRPAYDFEHILEQNEENLIGRFIESFQESEKDSIEYLALCEGVQALMEAGRGQL